MSPTLRIAFCHDKEPFKIVETSESVLHFVGEVVAGIDSRR